MTATATTVHGPRIVQNVPPPVLLKDGDRILIEGFGRPFYRVIRFKEGLVFPALRDEPSSKYGIKMGHKDRCEIDGKVFGFHDIVRRNGLENHRFHEA